MAGRGLGFDQTDGFQRQVSWIIGQHNGGNTAMYSAQRFFATITAALGLLAAPAGVSAGESMPGLPSGLHFMPNGVVLFHSLGQRIGAPACSSGTSARWALAAGTANGKVLLAGLLTAIARGKEVRIIGTGACADWGDSESVYYFWVAD